MITVDAASPTPPYEQLRSQVAVQIRLGLLPGGARLPSVRQLAGDLRVAPGTVARAYQLLEAEGLVTTNRASGTRVREGQALAPSLPDAAASYVRAARAAGASMSEATAAVQAAWGR